MNNKIHRVLQFIGRNISCIIHTQIPTYIHLHADGQIRWLVQSAIYTLEHEKNKCSPIGTQLHREDLNTYALPKLEVHRGSANTWLTGELKSFFTDPDCPDFLRVAQMCNLRNPFAPVKLLEQRIAAAQGPFATRLGIPWHWGERANIFVDVFGGSCVVA